jgi:osmoprotectant transport system permease protein
VNQFVAAFVWIFDPAHSVGPNGIPVRLSEHVQYTLLTLVIAVAIALPIGLLVGHTGKGRFAAVQISGALRALPTLGLVTLLALLLGLGIIAPLIAMVLLALPPIIAGAYAGIGAVNPETVDAARGVGMTEWQVLWKVEVPIALPLIIGGVRSACLQVIATWTVAAVLPLGGLGRYLYDALPLQDYPQMLAGSILVIALALVADGLFALLQRLVVPRGVVIAGRVGEEGKRRVRSATDADAADAQSETVAQ